MYPESFAVLIVTSDTALRRFIRDLLKTTGFLLAEARSTQEAVDMVCQKPYDVGLVDLKVPDHGAAHACRSLRAQLPNIGLIVIRTDGTSEDAGQIFEAGADDCLVAPFRFREIVARIGVVLRRAPAADPVTAVLYAGDIELDLTQRRLRRKGKDIHLSRREFDLLSVLMTNAGSAVTHEKLARSIWGTGTNGNRACLRTYIKTLREKIEEDPAHPRYILTQAWVGYRFQNHYN